jgi:hypothetical protein
MGSKEAEENPKQPGVRILIEVREYACSKLTGSRAASTTAAVGELATAVGEIEEAWPSEALRCGGSRSSMSTDGWGIRGRCGGGAD